jgi:iron complex outermembrane receptor protein
MWKNLLKKRPAVRTMLLLFFCLGAFGSADSQDATGTLTGEVKDEEGMVLPGVVVLANGPSGSKSAITGPDGRFEIKDLTPGSYDLKLELTGFAAIEQKAVAVSAGENSISFEMKAGGVEETMVITASKFETPLVDAPATMSVLDSETIEQSPAQNYGDLLRSVPGLNVIQTSARDIQMTSRQATNTLATSQLALLDGRSVYLDFFGFVQWDFLPVNFGEIKQIEVIRGPASAIWGANALTGVVNIITKTPREMQGGNVTLYGGFFGRNVEGAPDTNNGTSIGGNITWAQVINDTWSYKISGGYFNQDALSRPVGRVPISHIPGTDIITGGAEYPPYDNTGTTQPKFDFRLDQELSSDSRIIYAAGYGGTDGIIQTGIGPFDIQQGSYLGYGKVNYSRGNFHLNFFTNLLNSDANALLTRGINGQPLPFDVNTQTYDIDAGHAIPIGDKQIISFGGNYRRNNFDISLAPLGNDRNEIGGYIQDEIFFDKWRFTIGGRIDKFDVIEDPVFSPRLSAIFKPTEHHGIRGSYNRAFRSPSLINNFLEVTILSVIQLPIFGQFAFPTEAIGNENLVQESLTAYEVGYTGQFNNNKTLIDVAFYINDTDDNINFVPVLFYSPTNPPPGWPLPPQFVPPNTLPELFTYLNLGPVRNKGVEISWNQVLNDNIDFFVNYSYQKDPEILEADPDQIPYPVQELGFPPNNRFNVGMNFNNSRFLASASVNYAGDAFWTDVLDIRFYGPTEAYTMVNATFGVKWFNERLITSVRTTNLFNEQIQQHIFGDIIRDAWVFEARVNF